MAQQVMGTIINPPSVTQLNPKPIFVIRVPKNLSASEIQRVRDSVFKDTITEDYHVLVVPNATKDEYSFEMFNADKIEKQSWNTLVNKILV